MNASSSGSTACVLHPEDARENECSRRLVGLGFARGKVSPCCFDRATDDMICVVRGDDFVFEGDATKLKVVAMDLAKH